MGSTRRGEDLFTSKGDFRADTLRRVTQKGRASFYQASIILGWSTKRVSGDVSQGKIRTFKLGKMTYIPLDEITRLRNEQ